jgi:hypothetical protein
MKLILSLSHHSSEPHYKQPEKQIKMANDPFARSHTKRGFINRAFLIALLANGSFLHSGCSTSHENVYAERYRSNTIGATDGQLAAAFEPPVKSPQIIHADIVGANQILNGLQRQGYRTIGLSGITTALSFPDSDLLKIAKDNKADVVVSLSHYAGQHVVNLPYTNTIQSGGFSTTNIGATGTGYSSGQFYGDVNGGYSGTSQGELTGTVTTYTTPITSTQWIPTNVQYTQLIAVFYRKSIPGGLTISNTLPLHPL